MSLRILYVGNDLKLYGYLQDTLDVKVVRCVGVSDAKLLIKGINYSAVVLDEDKKELEPFTKRAWKGTLVVIAGSPESVIKKLRSLI